ncbi:MAG TPA: hypothetical protein ENH57_01105, partial [Actinobacteria bacterium]|nr:hypothetical protein [Actinomycetota bacterium]
MQRILSKKIKTKLRRIMFSNALKKVMLFGLIFTLAWSLNAVAIANATATVGSTEASAQFIDNNEGEIEVESPNVSTSSGDAKAEALSNTQGDSEGSVEAKLPPESNTASSTTPKEISSGESSKVSVSDYETIARTEDINISGDDQDPQSIVAGENVDNVAVTATGNLEINGKKLDKILVADNSHGYSKVSEEWKYSNENKPEGYEHIRAETKHEITKVSLFDGAITFDYG